MPVFDDSLYSRAQLLQAARARCANASERLITDWVERGLLDRPVRRGLGRGKGTAAGWPASQYRLWEQLLIHRGRGAGIGDLCNLPVGLWIYFGDAYVQLRQVRRALATWTGRYGGVRRWPEARAAARRLLSMLPDAAFRGRRRALVEDLARVLYNGFQQAGQAEAWRRDLVAAVETPGPDQLLPLPQAQVDVLMARLEVVRQLDHLADSSFHWARVFLLSGLDGYQREHQRIAEHYGPAVDAEPLTWNNLLPRACMDLLTVLGMGILAPDVQPVDAPGLSPRRWAARGMTSSVAGRPLLSRLVLPDGEHPLVGLGVKVTVAQTPSAETGKGRGR